MCLQRPEILEQYEKIIKYAFLLMEQQFQSSSPELAIITGCYSCLDRCFHRLNVGHSIVNSDKLKELYACLYKSIEIATGGEIQRYAMSSKALRLLKNHATRFTQLISLNIEKIHSVVFACYKSDIKALKKHAEDTLHAILAQLARYVIETKYPLCVTFLRGLVIKFHEDLTRTPPSPPFHVLLAASGLSAVAPALMILHSTKQESEIFVYGALNALIKSSVLIEATSEAASLEIYDRRDSSIFRRAQFLLAVSCIFNSVSSKISCSEI